MSATRFAGHAKNAGLAKKMLQKRSRLPKQRSCTTKVENTRPITKRRKNSQNFTAYNSSNNYEENAVFPRYAFKCTGGLLSVVSLVLSTLTYLVWFLATFFLFFFLLALVANKNSLSERRPMPKGWRPRVTVIAPAYNEQGKIAKTINSLKRISYANVEFIIVNDGSSDNTAAEAREAIAGDTRFVLIDRANNKGKAASLNEAIARARGDFIATMDADSMVEPRVFEKTLGYFTDTQVGAVTISVAVHKPKTVLDKVIDMEYLIGLSLFLKVFSKVNCVFVTPGPFSIYRTTLVRKLGGFDENNVVEDLEIAYRIHKAGYRIENSRDAVVHTIIPPTFKGLYIQRRRWYSGAVQTIHQHRDMLFRRKFGTFGMFMPFQFVLTVLGLLLFGVVVAVALGHVWDFFSAIRYTGLDVFTRMFEFEIDPLRLRGVDMLGGLAFFASFVLLGIGLLVTRIHFRERIVGIIGYPLMFFLYQIFWVGAFIAVLRGRKVSWR
jgi:cellulose synthase/poly-beta-1,6-N-acetylglucosamine synthase-like glycosyltransferase